MQYKIKKKYRQRPYGDEEKMFNIYNSKSKRKLTMIICIVLIVAMVATSLLAMLS